MPIYFNADVRAEEGANFICFSTQRYAGNSAFITLNDGDILVGTKKVGSYICDKWYEVTVILDRSTDTIDVWFDGEKLADDTEINFIHEDSNSYIAFSTQNSSASVYIDDITISNSIPEIPETDTFRIDAELYGISEITHSSPMKILLDLRGVQKSIQNAELCVVLSGSELGADFEIFSGNNAVTKRSLNANGRILYIDMTDYVTARKINEYGSINSEPRENG